MQRKPKIWVLGDIFSSAFIVKYVFGRCDTSSGRYLGLIDLATLRTRSRGGGGTELCKRPSILFSRLGAFKHTARERNIVKVPSDAAGGKESLGGNGRKEGRKKGLQPLKRRLNLSNFIFSRRNSLLLKGISREPDLDKLFNLNEFCHFP